MPIDEYGDYKGPLARGYRALSVEQLRFIDWLAGGEERLAGESQNAFAARLGVNPGTLVKWKKHPQFMAAWSEQVQQTWGSPDRYDKILSALYEKATDGDIKAAELFLKAVDKMTPDRLSIEDGRRSLEDLSDDELASLADNVVQMRRRAANDG